MITTNLKQLFYISILISFFSLAAGAQTTAFSYQGRLVDAGSPANGNFQLQFKLFDSLSGGVQIGSTIMDVPVTAAQGIFSARLDFGSNALSGANRWLEIAVRRNSGDSYTTLSPREQIASAPYSVRTLSAAVADVALNSNQLGGVNASEYVTNTSNSFIRNQATLQPTSNFNISGNGLFGGNVGIGTTNPASKLDVRGNLTLEAGTSPALFTSALSGEQNRYLGLFNSPTTLSSSGLKAGGILVSDDYSFANPAKTDLIVKGNVGIGTAAPQSKLAVSTGPGYGFTQTDGTVTVGSYVSSIIGGPTGWYGTKSNHPLAFFTNNGGAQMTVTTNGNVGIGTTTPSTRLALSGGAPWTNAQWAGSLSMQNASALGWEANSAGQQFGIGQTNGGLVFFRTISPFGNTSFPSNYEMILTDSGNVSIGAGPQTDTAKLVVDGAASNGITIAVSGDATQVRTSGGWAKAMIYVAAKGTISRCYNGVVGLRSGGCDQACDLYYNF